MAIYLARGVQEVDCVTYGINLDTLLQTKIATSIVDREESVWKFFWLCCHEMAFIVQCRARAGVWNKMF